MGLSKDEREELEDVFKKYDKDGDGNIVQTELAQMMKELGRETTQEELQDMINEMDLDGDGSI